MEVNKIAKPNDLELHTVLATMCRTALVQVTSLPLVEAYFTLRSLFGLPNSERDRLKTQWCYVLTYDRYVLEVYDMHLRSHFSIGVWESHPAGKGVLAFGDYESQAEAVGEEFLKLLTYESTRVRQAIAEAAKSPAGYVTENIFAQYYFAADDLLKQAQRRSNAQGSLCQGAFLLFMASVEAFVNLIYELFLSPGLRSEQIVGELRRSRLDMKIRLAPLYCTCFQGSVIDGSHPDFVNYLTMLKLRNRFVHANVSEPMRHPVIQKDGHLFMAELRGGTASEPVMLSQVTPDDVETLKSSVDALVVLLFDSMKPELRDYAEDAFWNSADFGLSDDDDVLGIHVGKKRP